MYRMVNFRGYDDDAHSGYRGRHARRTQLGMNAGAAVFPLAGPRCWTFGPSCWGGAGRARRPSSAALAGSAESANRGRPQRSGRRAPPVEAWKSGKAARTKKTPNKNPSIYWGGTGKKTKADILFFFLGKVLVGRMIFFCFRPASSTRGAWHFLSSRANRCWRSGLGGLEPYSWAPHQSSWKELDISGSW